MEELEVCTENYIEFKGFGIPAIGLCYLTIRDRDEILQKIVFKNEITLQEITVHDILTTGPKQVSKEESSVFYKTIQERPYEDRIKCVKEFLKFEVIPQSSMWAWQLLIYTFVQFTGVSVLFHLKTVLSFSTEWIWPCNDSGFLSEKDPICFTSIFFKELTFHSFIKALRNSILEANIVSSTSSFWFAGCSLFRSLLLVNGGSGDYGLYHTNVLLYCPPILAPKCSQDNLIQLVTSYSLLISQYALIFNPIHLES